MSLAERLLQHERKPQAAGLAAASCLSDAQHAVRRPDWRANIRLFVFLRRRGCLPVCSNGDHNPQFRANRTALALRTRTCEFSGMFLQAFDVWGVSVDVFVPPFFFI